MDATPTTPAGTFSTRFKDIGKAVWWTSTAVGLATLLASSGFSVDLVNASIKAAQGGSAEAGDYMTVLTVAFSAFPLVAALLLSAALLGAIDLDWSGPARIAVLCIVWLAAGAWSAGFNTLTIADALATTSGPLPVRLIATGWQLTTAPYSAILLIQSVVVAASVVASFFVLKDRWSRPAAEQVPGSHP